LGWYFIDLGPVADPAKNQYYILLSPALSGLPFSQWRGIDGGKVSMKTVANSKGYWLCRLSC
jgi:hypothetical protein